MPIAMQYGSGKYTRSGGASGGGSGGGITMSLLWTNPSPASSFAPQTVSLDLSSYDAVMVLARNFSATDANVALVSAFTLLGEYGAILTTSPASSNSGSRKFQATSAGIVFERCGYNGATQNNNIVPLYIYGIKGIT